MKDDFIIKGRASMDENYTVHIDPSLIEEKASTDSKIYLSDFMFRLPDNCVLLKGCTGCGATTLALQEDTNFILALPTRNTVISKWVKRDKDNNIISANEDLFCVFGGCNDKPTDLKEYVKSRSGGKHIKIVCTYDQVEKLAHWLIGQVWEKDKWVFCGGDDYLCLNIREKFRLIIDEIHQVLDDYQTLSRRDHINGMLQSVKMFDNVTCITATPLPKKYWFDEIQHLETVNVEYNLPKPYIERIDCGSINDAMFNVIMDHLSDRAFGNAHIFVNSVKTILQVFKRVATAKGMDATMCFENIRIVCGQEDTNERMIKSVVRDISVRYGKNKLGLKLDEAISRSLQDTEKFQQMPIAGINSPVKKVNLYTRCAWLGSDVFDPEAQLYIFSDSTKTFTIPDISTSYIQILGRVRDSSNNSVKHYARFKDQRYIKTEEETMTEFERQKANRAEERESFSKMWDLDSRVLRRPDNWEELYLRLYYLRYQASDDSFHYDKYLEWYDEIKFMSSNIDYINPANLSAALMKQGFNVTDTVLTVLTEKVKRKRNTRYTFKEMFTEYAQMKKESPMSPITAKKITFIEEEDPLVADAYNKLGEEQVEALGYKRRETQKEVDWVILKETFTDVQKRLGLKVGGTYQPTEINNKCARLERSMCLPFKIRITQYYDITKTTQRVNGEHIKVYRVTGLRSALDLIK